MNKSTSYAVLDDIILCTEPFFTIGFGFSLFSPLPTFTTLQKGSHFTLTCSVFHEITTGRVSIPISKAKIYELISSQKIIRTEEKTCKNGGDHSFKKASGGWGHTFMQCCHCGRCPGEIELYV